MKSKLKVITFLTAMVMAVVGICACLTGCEGNVGTISSLENAYLQGVISPEALKNIAYYYNKRTDEINDDSGNRNDESTQFTPQEKVPQELDKETERKIKAAFKNTFPHDLKKHIKSVTIVSYYGTYDGNAAIYLYPVYNGICVDPIVYKAYQIGEEIFINYCPGTMCIWNNGEN